MKKCNSCGEINKDNSQFCIKCGKQLSNFTPLCPNCKSIITPDDVFCNKCGKSIIESGSKQEAAKIETSKYIKKPVVETGRNRNFKIFMGLIGGFVTVAIIVALLVFVVDIGNLTNPFKSITEAEEPKEDGLEETAREEEDENPFNTNISSSFTFDNTANDLIFTGEEDLLPEVYSITPTTGTVGTMIQITGSNLTNSGFKNATIGKQELIISSASSDMIELYVSNNALTGNIVLDFGDKTIDAGEFKVLPQEKQLLLENEILPSDEPQTVSTENIAVTIPANAIESSKTIKIEEIANPHPINLPQSAQCTSFSVTLGDMHQFNDIITIEYTIPSDAQGEPSAAYFNEETSLWDTLPSEIINGKLYIYTNHLTDFLIFYWGKSIYSSGGFFKIYYHTDDVTKFAGSMDELAIKVGDALEKIKKDYEAKIPAGYREDFSYLGFTDSMDVYIDSDYFAGKYNALTNNLVMPTDYTDIDDFETVLAHEFFHSYQDTVWNEIMVVGTMGRAENLWAVEAMAELAAYEIAFPEKKRQRDITGGISSKSPFNTFDEGHEYSMSCYLSYLLKKTNSTPEELWIHVAGSDKYLIENSINEFFGNKSMDFISLAAEYTEFWREVLGNSDVAKQWELFHQFEGRIVEFKANDHLGYFMYQTPKTDTIAFAMFIVKGYGENVNSRIFNVETMDVSKNSVWSTQIDGTDKISSINPLRIPGGHWWNHMSTTSESPSGYYERYEFKKGSESIVLIGLDSMLKNELSGVVISEIQAQCKPAKIENASVGKEYEFEFAFKDIFANVTNVVIEVDFGDGEVKSYSKTNENGELSGTVKHTYDNLVDTAVKCSLFDSTQTDKELIAQIIIPVLVDVQAIVFINPNPVTLGEAVSCSTNITNDDYTYKWNLGDGTKLDEVGLYKTEHIYSLEGMYPISVEIYDGKDELVGKATQNITVALPEVITPSNEGIVGTWIYQSDTAIYSLNFAVAYTVSTFVLNSDGTCSYEYLPVILREPTDYIEDEERINLLNTYPTRYPGMAVPEYEGGQGTYTYLGKGNYFEENQVGGATILLTTASSQYEYYNPIYLLDGKLIFSSTEFTKK